MPEGNAASSSDRDSLARAEAPGGEWREEVRALRAPGRERGWERGLEHGWERGSVAGS